MTYFRRAFGITFSSLVLFFVLVFGLVLVSDIALENGFSSGEALYLELLEDKIIFEILGESFLFDISPVSSVLISIRNFVVLLPPYLQFAARFLVNAFETL